MRTVFGRWPFVVLASAAFALLPGCVATGGGYVNDGDYYYGPSGYVYEGWGPTYRVGPPRRGHDDHHDDGHHDAPHGHPPAYHAAPSSRPVPSIPTQSHAPPSRGPGGHKP